MNRYPPEPLTQEERELAQLTSRLGPHGEPSPSLDAKIRAAAHAAASGIRSRPRKPRWPVAMGLAASAVLAIGIAWQLRPVQQMAAVSSEAPPVATDQGEKAAPGPAATPPAPVEAVTQDSTASIQQVPMPVPPPPPPPEPEPAPAPAKAVAQPQQRIAPQASRAAQSPMPSAQNEVRSYDRDRAANLMPAPPAPAATMTSSAPLAEPPMAFAADSPGETQADSSAGVVGGYAGGRTAAAKESASQGELKADATARAQAGETLDRIEVTGSRLKRTDLQVPVSDDARLPVEEWIERVRTRYGLGDAGAAKQSLLLFVRDHPEETVPGDLEPLLEK